MGWETKKDPTAVNADVVVAAAGVVVDAVTAAAAASSFLFCWVQKKSWRDSCCKTLFPKLGNI